MKELKYLTRIVVVDDHPIVRHGLSRLIEMQTDMEVCAELDGSEDIQRIISELNPDILILDIALAHSDGITLTRRLRNAGRSIPIIILSMHESKVYVSRAIRAGANGYVTKNQSSEYLVEAIREVRQGRMFICGESADEMLRTVSAYHASEDDLPLNLLSDRERQIFTLIGRGFSTVEIAAKLLIRPKTVETYRGRIKEKLELDTSQRLSMAAIEWSTREGLTAPAV